MFSRFTEKAIQVIMLAQEDAKRFHHSYVGTEHLLLGIIGEGDNIVVKMLQEQGFSPEEIRIEIEDRLEYGGVSSSSSNIPFTQQAKQVLSHAWDEARKLGHNYVNVEHLFLSIFNDPNNVASKVLEEKGVSGELFREQLFSKLGDQVEVSQKTSTGTPTPTLDLYGRDLTWMAKDNKLDPVIGRSREIERIVQILSRRTKNNPVLTGDPGVGKTAIVEGLAQKIISKEIPEKLENKRVVSLDLGLLVAGTKYRGEFEDRVKKVMEEVRKADNVILFIDELHTIIGTGGSEGSLDAANLFKPSLARGELQCIGSTTLEEYRKHIEGDGALERRFQSVLIEEPSKEETFEILKGIKSQYEDFHQVIITEEALQEAVFLSERYITERQLPDKAVDVIDEAASRIMLRSSRAPEGLKKLQTEQMQHKKEVSQAKEKGDTDLVALLKKKEQEFSNRLSDYSKEELAKASRLVDEHAIAETVSSWTGIPVVKLSEEESEKLLKLDEALKTKIIGQDEGVNAVSRAVKRSKIGLKDPNRPTGSFLFLGPTGVGKSELAKQLAELMFGSTDALVRIDMSEYMEKHTVSRLIGAPPGYVGFQEGGQLSEPVRRKPYSIVLFDELEKASPDVINVLLQVLDDGRITDSNGKTVSFKNTIIIMTSNVGAQYIQKETSFGFSKQGDEKETNYKNMKTKLTDELGRQFKPEFLNRIDDIVIFKTLDEESIYKIIDIMLVDVVERLKERQIKVKFDAAVKKLLVEKGTNLRQGARPLKRAIQEYFEDGLADVLLKKNLKGNLSVSATVKDDKISFSVRAIKKKPVLKNISPESSTLAPA
ncbi:ATP-dependent Clp protease ATP-binding subunit ClpC [Candidatus Marinamargulisbacteria bacterium SCGC AG-439-L15]|nr:ATP-dependent Clp protease ATP-binding subunit ClpC [Candidatus Marinamargulisbacteria bacterium SCGC AG-439-L15]